jgi:7-carboxy-7-deazaguanine synthase
LTLAAPSLLLRVNEVFFTIQGEGRTMGLPTVFVRTSGCNLRCSWCDTTYSFYEGEETPITEVLATIDKFPARRVCLTGGEPLLQKDSVALVQELLARGYQVTVETSGSLSVESYARLEPRRSLVVSLDVKCPGSGMANENDWANLLLLQPHDQLKFVIAGEEDYAYAKQVLRSHPVSAEVIFQACWLDGSSNLQWLAERVLRDGLDVRVGTQLHKHIWGEQRGH